jgi:HD-like signal output (HDOD) protein
MRFFKSRIIYAPKPAPPAIEPVERKITLAGIEERDAVSLYSNSTIRNYRTGELILEAEENPNFRIIAEGSVQMAATIGGRKTREIYYSTGECLAPFRKRQNLEYRYESTDISTVIEVSPKSLPLLSPALQLWIHQRAGESSDRVQGELLMHGTESVRANALLTLYVENQLAKARSVVFSKFVQGFVEKTPRMPAFAMDVAAMLLDDRTSVKDVVEAIKRDPSLAALLLKTVNSALFGFSRKIESFYHACTLLGFNNIYQLVLRDGLRHLMPPSAETERIHAHSCRISALCYETAIACGKIHAQTATTCGLLHDIGSGLVFLMKKENPVATDFISLIDTAKIGSDLLQHWGLPDRICRVVELQKSPEFAPPEMIEADFREDLAVLHLAHLFEHLLSGEALDATSTIHTAEYARLLGIRNNTPEEFFKTRIVPALIRNKARYAEEVRTAITAYEEREGTRD